MEYDPPGEVVGVRPRTHRRHRRRLRRALVELARGPGHLLEAGLSRSCTGGGQVDEGKAGKRDEGWWDGMRGPVGTTLVVASV